MKTKNIKANSKYYNKSENKTEKSMLQIQTELLYCTTWHKNMEFTQEIYKLQPRKKSQMT